jgi:hypothetical protein
MMREGFLSMEGTEGDIVGTLPGDRDAVGPDHVGQIVGLFDGFDLLVGELHRTTSFQKAVKEKLGQNQRCMLLPFWFD